MSKADQLFVTMCQDIIENGFSTEGQKAPTLAGRNTGPHHQEFRCGEPV